MIYKTGNAMIAVVGQPIGGVERPGEGDGLGDGRFQSAISGQERQVLFDSSLDDGGLFGSDPVGG